MDVEIDGSMLFQNVKKQLILKAVHWLLLCGVISGEVTKST